MPLVWDQTTYERMYARRDSDPDSAAFGELIHYGRAYYDANLTPFARRLAWLTGLGMDASDRVLVGGCGYGFLIEVMRDAGFTSVWGIDSSPHIQARRALETRGDVLLVEDDMRGGGRIRAALRSLTGDDIFDWVIDEDALSSFSDGELAGMLNACESVLSPSKPTSNIVHMVTPLLPGHRQDPAINWKLLSTWKQIRPAHTWIDIRTGEIA